MYIPMQAHINVGFFFMSGLIKFQVVLKLEFDLIHKYHMLLNYLSLLKLELDLVYCIVYIHRYTSFLNEAALTKAVSTKAAFV
jgi:hypothetical protein